MSSTSSTQNYNQDTRSNSSYDERPNKVQRVENLTSNSSYVSNRDSNQKQHHYQSSNSWQRSSSSQQSSSSSSYSSSSSRSISNSSSKSQERERNDSRTSSRTPDTNNSSSGQSAQQKAIPWGSRSVDMFEKIEQIGEGTYGKVYLARNKETNEQVALKKIRMDNEKEGFPITAIREIKILKELRHENIIQLKEIVTSKATKESKGEASIYMVFEYMDHDLTGLMMNDGSWNPNVSHIKCYMKQLLQGLHYCHTNNVLHRDIKGSNLLLNNKGQLKLADFGLARPYTEQLGHYTNRVITLWYRPPELLLGAVQYGPAIDMWSVGCILAELLAKRAIFPGKNEIDQLEQIYKLCGTPTEENWPDAAKLPWYKSFKLPKVYKRSLKETFRHFPPDALDLVDKLLTLDPKKRITASEALDSEYFWCHPLPCEPSMIPSFPFSSHEFQAKKRKQQQSQADAIKRQRGPSGPVTAPTAPYPNGNQQYNRSGPPSAKLPPPSVPQTAPIPHRPNGPTPSQRSSGLPSQRPPSRT